MSLPNSFHVSFLFFKHIPLLDEAPVSALVNGNRPASVLACRPARPQKPTLSVLRCLVSRIPIICGRLVSPTHRFLAAGARLPAAPEKRLIIKVKVVWLCGRDPSASRPAAGSQRFTFPGGAWLPVPGTQGNFPPTFHRMVGPRCCFSSFCCQWSTDYICTVSCFS